MRARIFSLFVLVHACSAYGRQAAAPSGASAAPDLFAFEKQIAAAVVRGDVAFLDAVSAEDFSFTHGDGWTSGGAPLRVENKAQWLAAVSKRPYVSRDVDSQQLELHGDVAITYGRYRARTTAADPARNSFTVWYERVHARRNGGWQYLSHRTVRGPIYEQRGKSPQ